MSHTKTVALAVLLGICLGFITGVPSAVAQPVEPAPSVSATHVAAGPAVTAIGDCKVTPKPGVRAVIVRSKPKVGSARLGQINHGQRANAACKATDGGSYNAKGCTKSTWWVKVRWRGNTGFVAWGCVKWFRV